MPFARPRWLLRRFPTRVSTLTATATATVLSSRFEGFPLVLERGHGSRHPFIAYDLNYGPAEVIRHQIDGLLMHQATSRLWGNLPEAQARYDVFNALPLIVLPG